MSDEGEIAGLPIDEAVEVVVKHGDAQDSNTARTVLSEVADNGVVSWNSARDAFAHLAKVVSTPETRLELAKDEFEAVSESADDVEGSPLVRTRLETFEARLESVESRVNALGPELRGLLNRRDEPGELYTVAAGIRSLTAEANDCQRAGDELQVELEAFQRWLDDPVVRYEAFAEDLDALAESLHELEEATEAISARDGEDPAPGWLDAAVQARVLALVMADLWWELEELRRWDGNGIDAAEEVATELETQEARLQTIRDRLDEVVQPDWAGRYEDHLAAVGSTLAEFEPPVDWGAVERSLDSITPSE